MTLDAQKTALEGWSARLGNALSNLAALEADFTYKQLCDSSQSDGVISTLRGKTRAQLVPALSSMNELWKGMVLVQGVVAEAQQLYDEYQEWHKQTAVHRLLGKGVKDPAVTAAEIDRLLTSESIALPPIKTPLARRKLTTAGVVPKFISPNALFSMMEAFFAVVSGPVEVLRSGTRIALPDNEDPQPGDEVVCGLVTCIRQVWKRWHSQTSDAKDCVEQLLVRCREVGFPQDALLTVSDRVESVLSDLLHDPLGDQVGELVQIQSSIAEVRRQLDELDDARRNADKNLADAQQLLAELLALNVQAAERLAERESKILDPNPQRFPRPVPAAVLRDLEAWLLRLRPNVQSGKRSAIIGLSRWVVQVRAKIAEATACIVENESPCQERRELKGRFNCLQVKISAEGMARYDDVLSASSAAAAALQRPTDLAAARSLVDALERSIK